MKRRAAEEAQKARLEREEEEGGAKPKEQEQQVKEEEGVGAESKGETMVEETKVGVRTGGDASCLRF